MKNFIPSIRFLLLLSDKKFNIHCILPYINPLSYLFIIRACRLQGAAAKWFGFRSTAIFCYNTAAMRLKREA